MKQSLKGWILFCILSTATLVFAQTATTSLRGTIKDASGAMVPGAAVTLTDTATGAVYKAASNASGTYLFPVLSPSHYAISATATGFAVLNKTAELLVNQPATIDFVLSVQASTVTVDVSGTAQTLNTTDASLGNSADNELIQALPSETRNVPDLLSLQPGVLYLPTTSDSRSGAVNGVRSDQGNVTIDGIDDNDEVNGYAFFGVLRETQDSVQEFRVTTANPNADEGRSAGAQVSLVTKSGTNKFHGAAYEYNRPTITVANNWFNKQAQLDSDEANRPGKLIRNIFGGSFGGPIFKDKLFFFGNYEGTRKAESAQITQTVPTASYQAGEIVYQGDTATGTTNVTLTPNQITALDAGCQVCNSATYSPGPGPNPNALAYFNAMPASNGFTEGDGLNQGSYSFASPNPQTLNTSIARIDWTPTDRHKIFARGNLQKDTTGGTEQFPGQGPDNSYEDNTKGIIAGDTWAISSNLVNDVRYGFIRQGYSNHGVGNSDFVDFRFLTTQTAETRTSFNSVPVNNLVDNLTWTKGKHSFEFGGNWRLIHQNRVSNANSFNGASSNPYWLGGSPPDPSTLPGGLPVDGGFTNSYLIAYANLIGTIPSVTNVYNYHITSATSGDLLADGATIGRHFKGNEYEYYLQDAWRPTPTLTLTFGIRHSILQTPYETSGQQVAPTIDTHAWFLQREAQAQQSEIYEPSLTFAPTGPYYNKPGFWPKSKDNIAPRFAVAWAPNSKTSVRAGAGLYYDHYGQGLVNTFDQNGSFGVSSAITNPAGTYNYEDSPRFVGRSTLPFSNGTAPATAAFPYSPPTGASGFAITWGLDSQMKTPYSEAFNFSVQREIGKGFTLETDYVGTLGRHLLQSRDLAEPVDYIDPGGGGDYYAAGTKLSKAVDANGGGAGTVAAIPYFEDVFPWMAGLDYAGESATQAIYNNEWRPYRSNLGATSALADLDFYGPIFGFYPAPSNWQPHFWQGQFSSLYALSSIGMSYYNAGQVTLRHPTSHGLQLDVSYTYSHSIDMGSDAERAGGWASGSFSDILNTWKPALNRGSSDFDTRHLLTIDGVYQLPFGRGKALLGGANRVADAVIGGWQLSGISRTTSGLPWSLFEPGWSTNWQIESYGVVTGNLNQHRHYDQNGDPQYFTDPSAINSGVSSGTPVRLPYPGEAGERNNLRGDGYMDIDSGLAKTWALPEKATLKFSWEVYNVTNTVRFDPASIGSGLTGGNLGVASSLLTAPRVMQFSLRVDF